MDPSDRVTAEELAAVLAVDLSKVAPEREWTFHRIQDGYANGVPRAVFIAPDDEPVGVPLNWNEALVMALAVRLARAVRRLTAELEAIDDALNEINFVQRGDDDTLVARLGRLITDSNEMSAALEAAEAVEEALNVEKAAREALREKAAAALTKGRPEDIIALAAELDKPSARKP